MIEVILLDPRYFSRTEPSFADPSKPTCLDGVQWQWFKKTIKASDATFKIVMSGMVWDDKNNSESDECWATAADPRQHADGLAPAGLASEAWMRPRTPRWNR